MRSEPTVTEYAADLLREITTAHPRLTPKYLAELTGRNLATIYRYMSGDLVIPVCVLRAAFEVTVDVRLLQLVTGRIAGTFLCATNTPGQFICCRCVNTAAGDNGGATRASRRSQPRRTPPAALAPAPPRPISELLPTACESVRQTASALEYVGRIVNDGLVDASDDSAIAALKRHAAAAQRDLALLTAALDHHRGVTP